MSYAKDNADLLKHLRASLDYKGVVQKVAAATQIDEAIIWAIGSRETGWGTSPLLQPQGPTGTGDRSKRARGRFAGANGLPPDGLGWGRGLFQIDYAWHEFAQSGNWRDGEANIRYAIQTVLLSKMLYIKKKCPNLSPSALTVATIAAYNCGEGVVTHALAAGQDPDKFTAHGNYAADVIARGQWFRDNGGWGRV